MRLEELVINRDDDSYTRDPRVGVANRADNKTLMMINQSIYTFI